MVILSSNVQRSKKNLLLLLRLLRCWRYRQLCSFKMSETKYPMMSCHIQKNGVLHQPHCHENLKTYISTVCLLSGYTAGKVAPCPFTYATVHPCSQLVTWFLTCNDK
jgi:hypothetical protein